MLKDTREQRGFWKPLSCLGLLLFIGKKGESCCWSDWFWGLWRFSVYNLHVDGFSLLFPCVLLSNHNSLVTHTWLDLKESHRNEEEKEIMSKRWHFTTQWMVEAHLRKETKYWSLRYFLFLEGCSFNVSVSNIGQYYAITPLWAGSWTTELLADSSSPGLGIPTTVSFFTGLGMKIWSPCLLELS